MFHLNTHAKWTLHTTHRIVHVSCMFSVSSHSHIATMRLCAAAAMGDASVSSHDERETLKYSRKTQEERESMQRAPMTQHSSAFLPLPGIDRYHCNTLRESLSADSQHALLSALKGRAVIVLALRGTGSNTSFFKAPRGMSNVPRCAIPRSVYPSRRVITRMQNIFT